MSERFYSLLKSRNFGFLVIFISLINLSTAAKADQVQYLGESEESYIRLLDEVDSARRSIDMTYFIFNASSSISRIFIKKLIAKAHQGVRIRILLDANPQSEATQIALTQFFEKEGIEIKFYRRGWQYNVLNNARSHAKLFLVDEERYITGGRNIEDDYYGTSDWMNYIDREIWVRGSSARKALEDFKKIWNSPNSEVVRGSAEGSEALLKQWRKWDKKTFRVSAAVEARRKNRISGTPIVSCDDVQFTFDDERYASVLPDTVTGQNEEYMSGQRLRLKETTDEVIKVLMSAEKSISMENYSYLPTGEIATALRRAREKGIPVHLITNRDVEKESYAQSIQNVAIQRDNYGTHKIMQLSRHGMMRDAWAFKPAKTAFWTIHGKVFVVDHKTSIVGSFNIDPRSYHTNLETGVVVRDCPAFASIVEKKIQILERGFEMDKSCAKCQLPTRDNGIYKSFLGWIGYNFI